MATEQDMEVGAEYTAAAVGVGNEPVRNLSVRQVVARSGRTEGVRRETLRTYSRKVGRPLERRGRYIDCRTPFEIVRVGRDERGVGRERCSHERLPGLTRGRVMCKNSEKASCGEQVEQLLRTTGRIVAGGCRE